MTLLRLIGWTYADYLNQLYGPAPENWEPRSMRKKYERYASAEPPAGFRFRQRIYWQSENEQHPIALLLSRGRSRYLIFRGTVSESEWLRDMMMLQRPCPVDAGVGVNTGNVHRGFGRIYRSLQPKLDTLSLRPGWGGRLYIAGHSLGGALAALAALDLHHLRPRLYTFGTPRIGNVEFSQTINRLVKSYHRIENFWDPVVDLPKEHINLWVRRYEYRHAGLQKNIYALSQAGGDSIAELVHAKIDPWTYVKNGGDLDPLFTHQLSAYEHGLDKLLGTT